MMAGRLVEVNDLYTKTTSSLFVSFCVFVSNIGTGVCSLVCGCYYHISPILSL